MQHASRTEQWATSYASCHSRPKSVPWRQRCIWRGSMPAARLIAWCAGTSDSESRHSHSPRVASSLAFACPLDASVLMQSSSLCLENAAYFSRLGLSTSANLRQPSKGQWNTENPSPRLFSSWFWVVSSWQLKLTAPWRMDQLREGSPLDSPPYWKLPGMWHGLNNHSGWRKRGTMIHLLFNN